jgi:DNA-directed RNA polymerase subunit RPC12/RpoP
MRRLWVSGRPEFGFGTTLSARGSQREPRSVTLHPRTGLECAACQRAVAVVEYQTPTAMTFHCPACEYRWVAEHPGAPKH